MSLKNQNNSVLYPQTWKPKISNNINIVEVEGNFIMNQIELGYQLSINRDTLLLVNSLDGSKTVEEIAIQISKSTNSNVDIIGLFIFLRLNFLEKGFLDSELILKKRPNASHIFLKFPIIRNKLIDRLDLSWINWLFHKRFFYCSLLGLFFANIFFYNHYSSQFITVKASYWWLMILLFLCHFIHELGHVFSAKSVGIKPKEIGFGIYFVLPVFYTDLSDSWNTTAKNRIMINLSGIYFDFTLALIFYAIFYYTRNSFFVILASLSFIKTWYNLNPLLQSDMYWVLVDLFKRPNLTSDALLSVTNFWKNIRYPKKLTLNFLEASLFLYGMSILCFWIIIIYQFLFFGKILLNQLPKNFFQILKMIKTNTYELSLLINNLYNILFFFFTIFILVFSIRRLLLFLISTIKYR